MVAEGIIFIMAGQKRGRNFKFLSPEELQSKIRARIPQNTQNATMWASNTWNDWATSRNKAAPEQPQEQLECQHIPMAARFGTISTADLDKMLAY